MRKQRGWPLDAVKTRLPSTGNDYLHIRQQVAHHEAGHCVASAVLGFGYYSISINPNGGGTFFREQPGNSRRMSSDEIEDAAAVICRGWHPNLD